ncbi:MAG: adenine-specific methyltransferase EcoRI family protein, partial [Planctomycetaceae bacterium]|nr:adenine-specific methyltransferase EcoRI family protein [Planctomycetaceae bacterium]
DGVMGVPITFIDKYNPEQFEIVGHMHSGDYSPAVEALRTNPKRRHRGILPGRTEEIYARILIRKRV